MEDLLDPDGKREASIDAPMRDVESSRCDE